MDLLPHFKSILESPVAHASLAQDIYNGCVKALASAVSAQDIYDVIDCMRPFQDRQRFALLGGHFLSAAINLCDDRNLELSMRGLPVLDDLCFYLLERNVTVLGDVGSGLCTEGVSGQIHLRGNARTLLAQRLRGAEVIVDGCAGELVGDGMSRGIIRLNGTYTSLGRPRGGEIFRGEEMLYPTKPRGRRYGR